jgi:hypothetical protein
VGSPIYVDADGTSVGTELNSGSVRRGLGESGDVAEGGSGASGGSGAGTDTGALSTVPDPLLYAHPQEPGGNSLVRGIELEPILGLEPMPTEKVESVRSAHVAESVGGSPTADGASADTAGAGTGAGTGTGAGSGSAGADGSGADAGADVVRASTDTLSTVPSPTRAHTVSPSPGTTDHTPTS